MKLPTIVTGGIAVGMALIPPTQADDYTTAQSLLNEGFAAYETEDFATFRDRAAAAVKLRPDHARYLYSLAAGHALNGDAAEAAEVLRQLATWGIHLPAETSPAFAAVRDHPDMADALKALHENLTPHGEIQTAFEIPANGGLWEGIAYRSKTKETFHSDLHRALIFRRTKAGAITEFTHMPTAGFGCGGLAVDEKHSVLWVSSPAMPEVHSFTPELEGRSQLVAFDLTDRSVARIIDLPQSPDHPHTVVDLNIAPDGTVYTADSASPIVWRIAPESDQAEAWATIDSPGLRHSLQGSALSSDGAWLFVADYSTGLHAVSTKTAESTFLPWNGAPITTLLGIDGLSIDGDTLIASQNGVSPARVLAIDISLNSAPQITAIRTLASGWPELSDPTLLTSTDDGFLIIGNAGWLHFGDNPAPDSPERQIPILRLP